MANIVDPDQILPSDLGLHCLHRFVCPNTLGYYGMTYQEADSEGIRLTLDLILLFNVHFTTVNVCKIVGRVAYSGDPMLHSAASDLGLHCLLRPVCWNTQSKYCSLIKLTH